MNKSSKIILGVISGAAAGAFAAYLASDAGEPLRTKLFDGAKKLADEFTSQLTDKMGFAGAAKDELKNVAKQAMNRL